MSWGSWVNVVTNHNLEVGIQRQTEKVFFFFITTTTRLFTQ